MKQDILRRMEQMEEDEAELFEMLDADRVLPNAFLLINNHSDIGRVRKMTGLVKAIDESI